MPEDGPGVEKLLREEGVTGLFFVSFSFTFVFFSSLPFIVIQPKKNCLYPSSSLVHSTTAMSAAEMLALRKEQLEAELAKTEKTVRRKQNEQSSSTKKRDRQKKPSRPHSSSLSSFLTSLRRSTTLRASTSPQSTATPGRY